MPDIFIGHYNEWRESRIAGLDKYLVENFFEGKTLLEVACGKADIGHRLQNKGAIVKCCDARKEHLDVAKEMYPSIDTFLWDGDKDPIPEAFDIIVHWGLLYHLNKDNLNTHLVNVLTNCNYLLLESEVCDSSDLDVLETEEEGFDQAFNNRGSRPSESYIETILSDSNPH